MSCFSQCNDDNNNNNNSNYIPSFYTDMPSLPRQQVNESASHTRTFGAPHNFTFSHPTQGTTIPTPRPSIQTTSSMPFAWALGPGLGTTWQHSNPSSVMTNTSTSSVYTGMPARFEPQPSCSSPVKRPKRKAAEYSDDAPSSKVYLCADQFASLNLNNDRGHHEVKGHDPAGWGRFQEVENRIACDTDEEDAKDKEKGVVRINDAIADAISSQSSSGILPRNVLKEIAKPCMQVVLWKSPGELVRDLVREDSLDVSPAPPSPSIITHSLTSSRTSSSLRLSSTALKQSPKFMTTSSSRRSVSTSDSFSRTWLQNDISSSSYSSPFPLRSSSAPSQTELNALSSPPLCFSDSKSNIVTMSQADPGLWDNHLDLNFVGSCDEDMQL